jgi:bleomycin hydrolase
MKILSFYGTVAIFLIIAIPASSQPVQGIFRSPQPGFFQNSILKDDRDINEKMTPAVVPANFAADLSSLALPNKMDLYKNRQWHNPPLSQGNTNTCWCFSTTSFLESEIFRIHQKQIKLSEMYTVY